jgi:hypothetical protein
MDMDGEQVEYRCAEEGGKGRTGDRGVEDREILGGR